MNALSDPQLLRAYAERRSEAAFAELVRRHIDFVHSAAFRMVNDPHLAKDVSQGVFVALAKDAGKLTKHPVLSGWLHRTARNIAAQAVRTDVRRRKREQQAAAMTENFHTGASWEEIAPHLDAALSDLSEPDRDAVLLRYFENKPAQEMAAILGITAEAAQKRVSRAVEKLRENLARRGITAGTAGLASVISTNAVKAAPPGLAAILSSGALSSPVPPAVVATKILAMTTLQKALIIAAVATVAGTAIYHVHLQGESEKPARAELPEQSIPHERTARGGASLTEVIARARAEKTPTDRREDLEILKAKWLKTESSNDRANIDRQIALSTESAGKLLCSPEMLELMEFVKEHKFYNTLEYTVADLFRGSRAAEARRLLAELPETVKMVPGENSYLAGGDPIRDNWAYQAGIYCPEDEIEAFIESLHCESCGAEARYGRNFAMMPEDPLRAFRSSLEVFQSGVPSISGRYGLTRLFDAVLPEDVPWEVMEQMLPAIEPRTSAHHTWDPPFQDIRKSLLGAWGRADAAGAAKYLMACSDRLDPDLIRSVVSGAVSGPRANPGPVFEMVENLPDGEYFDAAAKSVVETARWRNPVAATKLAGRIQDPEIREQALRKLQAPSANPDTR